ncbi:uncharacterized protein LOC129694603 [Leucoraja erinacea]|uniref:uncharacterized protein LOC129694603 n=1 Tax=Leucoraja erinaceus TaxID=7782 RepID=UPI002456E606|nr:uncharacterized protein LOC129694603 [Leucoraja erinacea]
MILPYKQLAAIIQYGWPNRPSALPAGALPYFLVRDELLLHDGVVVKGHKVVVPAALHDHYFQAAHRGHPAAEATLSHAQRQLYWPGMAQYIRERVSSCSTCNSLAPPPATTAASAAGCTRTALDGGCTDIFEWRGKHFLVLVDSYSNWFEVDQLHSLTSSAVADKMHRHFSTFGNPASLQSDNGSQFKSSMFRAFATSWYFRHFTSSPEYPQSNGLAEQEQRACWNNVACLTPTSSWPSLTFATYPVTLQWAPLLSGSCLALPDPRSRWPSAQSSPLSSSPLLFRSALPLRAMFRSAPMTSPAAPFRAFSPVRSSACRPPPVTPSSLPSSPLLGHPGPISSTMQAPSTAGPANTCGSSTSHDRRPRILLLPHCNFGLRTMLCPPPLACHGLYPLSSISPILLRFALPRLPARCPLLTPHPLLPFCPCLLRLLLAPPCQFGRLHLFHFFLQGGKMARSEPGRDVLSSRLSAMATLLNRF